VTDNEIATASQPLVDLVKNVLVRVTQSKDPAVRKWAPKLTNFTCPNCDLNHELRDFIRAVLLHIIDHFDEQRSYVQYLKDSGFITPEVEKALLSSENEYDDLEEEDEEDF
jgi:hypothetical protein